MCVIPFVMLAALSGCKRGCRGEASASRAVELRDALLSQSKDPSKATPVQVVFNDYPRCGQEPDLLPCLKQHRQYFGGEGNFNAENPDEYDVASVAFMLREVPGARFTNAETWLGVMRMSDGAAAEALRIQVATSLAITMMLAPSEMNDEMSARMFLRSVGTLLPGACPIYLELGKGKPLDQFEPEKHPDRDGCVMRDLKRKGGPGPEYGRGVFRAAKAAEQLVFATNDALQDGLVHTKVGKDVVGASIGRVRDKLMTFSIRESGSLTEGHGH